MRIVTQRAIKTLAILQATIMAWDEVRDIPGPNGVTQQGLLAHIDQHLEELQGALRIMRRLTNTTSGA